MCWNKEVSLNTFLFSGFVLALIIYNNTYTKYKIQELNDVWTYLFIASFVSMQLIEFFIWKNIKDKFYNNFFSICATILLLIQPIASLMMLRNISLRNVLLYVYLACILPYSIYQFSTKHLHSVISEHGHLKWHFFDTSPVIWVFWLFFFLFSFLYEKKWFGLFFGLLTLIIAIVNYRLSSMASMWCWSVNSIMIYYAAYLLIILPFLERSSIC